MDIFIQSRGISKDYCWLSDKSLNLLDSIKNLTNILDTEFSCLILARKGNQLTLCITALESSRTDNRTRTIRNSVIWIGDKNDEVKLQSLIVDYLENPETLRQQIDQAVTFEPENGFKIDINKIPLGYERKLEPLPKKQDIHKIGNLEQLKPKLLEELKTYQLSEREGKGILIFISTIKSENALRDIKPWRGLSSQISGNDWINLSSQNAMVQTPRLNPEKKSPEGKKLLIILMSLFMTFSFILNGIFLVKVNNLNNRIQELEKRFNQIEKLKSTIDDSESYIKEAEISYEKDIQKAQEKFSQAEKQFEQDLLNAKINYQNNIDKVRKMLDDAITQVNQM